MIDRLAVALAALCIGGAGRAAETPRPLPGLAAPAEIKVDRWGIAHIYAASPRDAFFMQGYNAARDRLWQIDLWRKRGLGLLARDFGPAYVAQDRAARLLLYRGDMAAEWASYGADAKSQTEAFVAGVNAYVGEVRAGRAPLPPEFALAGSQPDLWHAEDIVRVRSHALTRNVTSEVARARIACAADLKADELRQSLKPKWETKIPDGLDPCAIPAEVLDTYRLGAAGVTFDKLQGVPVAALDIESEGSNNWVIAPSRTATGRPILANDPHRDLGIPSIRYVVHMEAPGLSAIGAGEPALPGISIGHNGQIAFGLTIFAADQEDLYVYVTEGDRYRYKGGWEPMQVVRETIEVKGAAPQTAELRFTRHGPVLHHDATRAFALRSVWSAPGTSAYFGSMRYMRAKDWPGFVAAMDGWGTPSENQVYADTRGHIGWIAAGRVPVRKNWDGLLPVPGDGRYEWDGFLPNEALPRSADPAAGFIATANEMNLPAGYPVAERKPGFEWAHTSRKERIDEVLHRQPKSTLADSMALQNDATNVVARQLLPLLTPLADDPQLGADVRLLQGWDGVAGADSPAAALFETWLIKHLRPATVAELTPPAARPLITSAEVAAVIDRLTGPTPADTRLRILRTSLTVAVAEVTAALGPDRTTWAWGKLHHVYLEHALQGLAGDKLDLSTAKLPGAGTYLSPLAAGWRADGRRMTGASFRMVLDVGKWDDSKVINGAGQSGDPASPHYRDHFELWATGRYVPLLYSRKAIDAATTQTLRFTPGR
ncbi:penicillin acylase family protein [Sphingoaurantiacus capsulatus]|uniref:Penicillin acylase family protein n=1 Tax=Sphingoaurantiacus capsulatus TaxID=1771310 RepID=A0ABV7XG87_9SPHN